MPQYQASIHCLNGAFILDHFKVNIPIPDRLQLVKELRFAASYLSSNKLLQSAKWASELLHTLSPHEVDLNSGGDCVLSDKIEERDLLPENPFKKVYFEGFSECSDVLNSARVLFDLREYRKASFILKPHVAGKAVAGKPGFKRNQNALFLYY